MKGINIFKANRSFFEYGLNTSIKGSSGLFDVPYRPLGMSGIKHKLRALLLVATGRADVLVWEDGQ